MYKQAAGAIKENANIFIFVIFCKNYNTSASMSGVSLTDSSVDRELAEIQNTLHFQDTRVRNLKDAIRRCRLKSGLPPIIPTILPPKRGVEYHPTAQEIPEMNQLCYPRKQTPTILSKKTQEKCAEPSGAQNTENEEEQTDEELEMFKEEFKDFLDSEKDEVMAYLAENDGEFLEKDVSEEQFSLPEINPGLQTFTSEEGGEFEDRFDDILKSETNISQAADIESGGKELSISESKSSFQAKITVDESEVLHKISPLTPGEDDDQLNELDE